MRPRRLFPTALKGKHERELPPATTAQGSCSWPPGTSLHRAAQVGGAWGRFLVEDEVAASHGPRFSFAAALDADPMPTCGGTSAQGPGSCRMTWQRAVSQGEATADLVLVVWGWGDLVLPHRLGSPLLHRDGNLGGPPARAGERVSDAPTAQPDLPRPGSWHRLCHKNPPQLRLWLPFGLV